MRRLSGTCRGASSATESDREQQLAKNYQQDRHHEDRKDPGEKPGGRGEECDDPADGAEDSNDDQELTNGEMSRVSGHVVGL
jgi:hypothetical protein